MTRLITVTVAFLAVAVGSTPAVAQFQKALDIGVGLAGAKGTGTGLTGQVAFELLPSVESPFGLRVDLSHSRWSSEMLNGMGSYHASAATFSMVYRLPTKRMRPYVLAGVGGYALRGEGIKEGWNVGGGV